MSGGDSDGDPEKYKSFEKAKRAFLIGVAKRKRNLERDSCEISHRTSSTSQRTSSKSQNAISAPVARHDHEHRRGRLVKPDATHGGRINSSASSSKNVNNERNKPRAYVRIPSEQFGYGKLLYQQGSESSDSEDIDPDELVVLDKAEFESNVSCSASKTGPSSKRKLKASFPAATPSSSAAYSKAFCPKDASRGFDHARTHASRSFVHKESDSDNMIPEEARFRNQKKHFFESKIGRLAEKTICKNVYGAEKKNISSATFSRRNYRTGRDMLAESSSMLATKVKNKEPMSCRNTKLKGDDEGELRNGKSSTMSKRGAFSMQGYSEEADIEKELSVDGYCESFSGDAGRDSYQEQVDRQSSFKETETEEVEVEEIDESASRKIKKQFVSEIGSSNLQEQNERHFAATSAKKVNRVSKDISFDKNKRKRKVSPYSDEVVGSTSIFLDPYSSPKSSDNDATVMQDDEVSSRDAKHWMDPGISSRTRAKMGSVRKPAGAVNFSNSLSIDSGPSPRNSGYHSYNHKDFEVEDDGKECSSLRAEAVKSEAVKSKKHKVYSRKRLRGGDASSKQAAEEWKAHQTCEVPEGKKQTYQTFREGAEGLKERNSRCDVVNELQLKDQSQEEMKRPRKGEEEGKSHKKDNKKGCDEEVNRVNELHPKDRSQAGVRRPEKAAAKEKSHKTCAVQEDSISQKTACSKKADLPSYSKNDDEYQSDDEDDDTQEITEAPSLVPTGTKYDICSMLADVVLGKGQMTEYDSVNGDKENHDEFMLAPASQIQFTPLPLKFRFEDEVPKPVEKTDHEKKLDIDFDELDSSWALEEMRTSNSLEVDLGKENSPAEETQYERCCRGKHELVLEDDKGLLCIFCHHVVHGPKDIIPELIERPNRDSSRRKIYSRTEGSLEFDELHFQSSMNKVAECDATGTVWNIKPGVRESMYEHQREGFEFLWKNLAGSINVDEVKSKSSDSGEVGGCIISHAPGTGKTFLTIVFIETYLKMFPNCRPVIIAPAGMLLTWEEEFKKWNVGYPFHNLNNSDLSGKETSAVGHLGAGKKRRDMEYIRMIKIFSWSKGGSVIGISYSLFETLTGKYKTNKNNKMGQILLEMPGLVVLDEGHTPRNQRSNIWNALLKLETQKRVILSGTPFQNNFGELFNTLRLVRPVVADVLAQEKTYAAMVASRRTSSSRKQQHEGAHSQSPLISEAGLENLKACMSPFLHVHKGTILQKNLPGLRDCVVLLKPSALQKSLIEGIQGSNNFKYEHEFALISVHPYLFLRCESTEAQMRGRIDMDAVRESKLHPQEGVKTRFVLELVRLSMAVDEKVLVFSQYILPLELIRDQLKETFKWVEGKQILLMKGKMDQKQRQTLIKSFNDPKGESKIMLASTRCCSEGISLVGASRVVLLDVVWNPSVERQAISRAYRIGQKKFVYTYHLMTSGTTEADKYCRQAQKERLSELVFTSANEQKHLSKCMEDRVLEVMVANQSLKGIFEKIINQPKEIDLIETFGL